MPDAETETPPGQLTLPLSTAEADAHAPGLAELMDVGTAIRAALDDIEVADEELEAAMRRYPEHRAELRDAFRALQPRDEILGQSMNPDLYRMHCRELCQRVGERGRDADLTTGTAAEVCRAFSEMSILAPLRHEYMVAYTVAFHDAFGARTATEILGAEAVRRAHIDREAPRVSEILRDVAHQVRDPDRTLGRSV